MGMGGATGEGNDLIDPRTGGRILYQDNKFYDAKCLTISENPHNIDEQSLVLETERQPLQLYLPRGKLQDFAMCDGQGLSQKICDLDPTFLTLLSKKSIPIESIGWALAKAYINYS
jgi:hypothetical protein